MPSGWNVQARGCKGVSRTCLLERGLGGGRLGLPQHEDSISHDSHARSIVGHEQSCSWMKAGDCPQQRELAAAALAVQG